MSNMEGLFANVGALACDLTPMNEIYDKDLFVDQIGKIMINGVKKMFMHTVTDLDFIVIMKTIF